MLLTRRSALRLAGAGTIAVVATRAGGRLALAQDATPMTGGASGESFAGLGFPELTVTISDSAFEGVPDQLDSGMYLVHATYSGSQSGNVVFMQLPEGMTSSDLMTALGGGDTGGATGSPAATGGEEGGGGEPPEWFYTTYIAGGAGVGPGQTAHFVIALQPGNYIVWAEDPSALQTPVDLAVNGSPATAEASSGTSPQADVTISEVATDNGFAFQFDGGPAAGVQVVAVTNNSDQPHFVEFDRVPDGTTREDVDALLQSFMSGTPMAGGLTEEDFQPVYFVGTQSAGTTQWHEIAFEAGTYVASCWIPDPTRGGTPHAMEGMHDVVTIG
jgi:hypothetical protein